jgi:hypothetical protein
MTTILEVTNGIEVAISRLDEQGIVVASVPLTTLQGDEMSALYHARTHAEEAGWQTAEDWNKNDEFAFCVIVPKPVTLAFAGTEIADDEAVRYARNAGFAVNEVVKQTYIPEEGKTYIAFSVDSPLNWSWPDGPLV